MALSQKNQLQIAFKKLFGKTHTNTNNGILNESTSSAVQLGLSTIFAGNIPADPTIGSSDQVELVTFELETIPGTDYPNSISGLSIQKDGDTSTTGFHAYKLKLPVGYVGNAPFVAGAVLADSSGKLQLVPPSFGGQYSAVLKTSNDTVIPPLDPIDYYLDYYSGVLFVSNIIAIPSKITAYLYKGSFANSKGAVSVYTEGYVTGSGTVTDKIGLKPDISLTSVTASSALINGNLTVAGTASFGVVNTVSQTTLTVKDKQIVVASGSFSTDGYDGLDNAGLLYGSDDKAHVLYKTADNKIEIAPGLNVSGSLSASSGITGSFSGSFRGDVVIGQAEDNSYSDGLYGDLTPVTPVGTVVDRFNEILKGLCPPAAPSLDNAERNTSGGNNLKLAFSSTKQVPGYSNADTTPDSTNLPAVPFSSSFSVLLGAGGNPIRMGVFNQTQSLTLVLNNDVQANGSPFVNYPTKSFNVPSDGQATYALNVNGATVSSTNPGLNAFSSTTINLSQAITGTFPTTGQSFNIFRSRTGTVTIPTSSWRNGYNYATITDSSTNLSASVDWVYDISASNGVAPHTFTSFGTSSAVFGGSKWLSGIQYYTGSTYNAIGTINNYYKNTYVDNGVSISPTTTVTVTPHGTVAAPTDNNSTVSINSPHTISNTRYLGTAATSSITASNGIGKTGTTTVSTQTMLIDSVNTTNSDLVENFCLEDYRLASGSYDVAITGVTAFASGSSLAASELAVYNGAVRAASSVPYTTLNGAVHKLSAPPNYTTNTTGNAVYIRAFKNTTGSRARFNLYLSGQSCQVVSSGTALSTNTIKVSIKQPGITGWRDIATAADGNLGCLEGTLSTSPGSTSCIINFLTNTFNDGSWFVLRIEALNQWAGNINNITLTPAA